MLKLRETFSIIEKTNHYKKLYLRRAYFFRSSERNYRKKVEMFFHANTLLKTKIQNTYKYYLRHNNIWGLRTTRT